MRAEQNQMKSQEKLPSCKDNETNSLEKLGSLLFFCPSQQKSTVCDGRCHNFQGRMGAVSSHW